MSRILVVDDDNALLRALSIILGARGYEFTGAHSGPEALDACAHRNPDLVLLDLGLPGIDGVEVIRGIRGWSQVPIIVLSARHQTKDKVDALDAGGDDFVTKPFDAAELLARVRSALRRGTPEPSPPRIAVGQHVIDLAAHRIDPKSPPNVPGTGLESQAARRRGETSDVIESGPHAISRDASNEKPPPPAKLRLTPKEWGVVEMLVSNPGRLVTQRQLLTELWGPDFTEETEYLRVLMARIRRKLEPDPRRPRHFLTEPGIGYRFEP